MLSSRLMAPFVFAALGFLYMTWEKGSSWAIYIVPCFLVLAAIYVLSPQIDWWWARRYPPKLPEQLRSFLNKFSLFYQRLDAAEQIRFEQRAALFLMGTEWVGQGWESVPKDVQLVLASYGVQLNFHTEDLLFEKFEKIIVYQHPFPSPAHPTWHHSEIYEPDGCMLISAEQLLQGYVAPKEHYQIGLHEYAKIFILSHPDLPWPTVSEAAWADLEKINGMGRKHVEAMVGLPVVDALPVALHHYFTFPVEFRAVLPMLTAAFDAIFSEKKAIATAE